ncbi:hypothetical protein CXIVA_12880 [Clostridium sp. SY8519]|uniref:hypothetical protein n=1 Tax=Clostridium sp. (strain SY8519) TaxID=1042156 RepID=UPI0002171F1E|nr:hypothetical protein [Clostridium sp. SY8519]BAK47254.1 hypothetical protein CXIVA_12880 [Clostridium sp. SY8519]
MNQTMDKLNEQKNELLAVDTRGLAAMLSCGMGTARKIGEDAGAKIIIGRRVLFSVSKIKKYLEIMAE